MSVVPRIVTESTGNRLPSLFAWIASPRTDFTFNIQLLNGSDLLFTEISLIVQLVFAYIRQIEIPTAYARKRQHAIASSSHMPVILLTNHYRFYYCTSTVPILIQIFTLYLYLYLFFYFYFQSTINFFVLFNIQNNQTRRCNCRLRTFIFFITAQKIFHLDFVKYTS